MARGRLTARRRAGLWIATLGGLGYCPKMPGTAASLAAVALHALLPRDPWLHAALVSAACVLGVWSARIAAEASGTEDPSHVVVDEAAGMWLACVMVPASPWTLAAAFALFRLFDIAKPFPVNRLERLPGGWGIMADDIAAGALARLLLLWWV